MNTIRFALPSIGMQGHTIPHDSGNVTLTLMSGPRLMASFSLMGMTPAEARGIAAALNEAADQAASAKAEARAEAATAGCGS